LLGSARNNWPQQQIILLQQAITFGAATKHTGSFRFGPCPHAAGHAMKQALRIGSQVGLALDAGDRPKFRLQIVRTIFTLTCEEVSGQSARHFQ